jgi:uncharacterized protein YqjF (DUF2071 family)
VALPIIGPERVLRRRAHRPWPLPDGHWLMAQRWENLLFAHWPVAESALRPVVPPELPLDTFDGRAWIGVTPFQIGAHRFGGTPHIPRLTSFPEVNVRTYTTIGGKPGIFFFSLDTVSKLVVMGARRVYRLPYFRSRISLSEGSGGIEFRASRRSGDGPAAELDIRYRPTGPARAPAPGSLEYFLAERYCLYTLDDRRRAHRSDIHHPPWPVQDAEATVTRNTMAAGIGLGLEQVPLTHFARRQEVLIWPPGRVEDER